MVLALDHPTYLLELPARRVGRGIRPLASALGRITELSDESTDRASFGPVDTLLRLLCASRREKLQRNSFVVPDAALADQPAALWALIVPAAYSAEVGDSLSELCTRAIG